MSEQPHPSGAAARSLPPFPPTIHEEFPRRMRDHLHQLRRILPVVSVSVLALRGQNADLDEDVASVLQQHVVTPLDLQIEALEDLLDVYVTQQFEGVVS